MTFELNPRIQADTYHVCDLDVSRVLLMNDTNYPWVMLVPMENGLVEITDLSKEKQHILLDETTRVMDALKALTNCKKLNVANLGNVVSQLHVHVVAREETDAAWPGPIWGKVPTVPYQEEEAQRFIEALKAQI